jgi:hypothetical protein
VSTWFIVPPIGAAFSVRGNAVIFGPFTGHERPVPTRPCKPRPWQVSSPNLDSESMQT